MPLPIAIPVEALSDERFLARYWAFVERVPDAEACWLWTGNANPSGYGQISFTVWVRQFGRRHIMLAHRVGYTLAKGEIPEGMLVLHSCDNPRCVNPDHLRCGTARDNAADALSRGRHVVSEVQRRKGPEHPAARYSQEVRDEAIRLLVQEMLPYQRVVDMLGVGMGTLGRWMAETHGQHYRRKNPVQVTRAVRQEIERTGRWSKWKPGYTLVDGKPTYTG